MLFFESYLAGQDGPFGGPILAIGSYSLIHVLLWLIFFKATYHRERQGGGAAAICW